MTNPFDIDTQNALVEARIDQLRQEERIRFPDTGDRSRQVLSVRSGLAARTIGMLLIRIGARLAGVRVRSEPARVSL